MDALEVYQMFRNTDMEEGRGDDVAIPGLFDNVRAAEETAVGRGVYGSPAVVKAVPLFRTATEYRSWERTMDPEYQLYLKLHEKFGN